MTPFAESRGRLGSLTGLDSFKSSMNIQSSNIFLDRGPPSSSSCDSSDQDEEGYCPKTNPLKHKTEMCKTHSELGYCNYSSKCRFAHSRDELVLLPGNRAFRKKKCQSYWVDGCCQYGLRCKFGHANTTWQDSACLLGLQAGHRTEQTEQRHSKLLRKLW
jgi:hypothetical protein